MYDHFSTIASKYQSVRTLDIKPILHIKEKLAQKEKIQMADVGCGDGRYSSELLKEFDNSFYIHCVDYNENMLKSLESNFREQNITNFCVRKGDANRLPLDNKSMIVLLPLMQYIILMFQSFYQNHCVHSKIMEIYSYTQDYEIRIAEVCGANIFHYLGIWRIVSMN